MKNGEFIEKDFGLVQETVNYMEYVNSLQRHEIKVGRTILQPDKDTVLDGWFNIKPAKYVGMEENLMIFYLGEDKGKHYFFKLLRVTETRIFNLFGYGYGRDFNFIHDVWDWERTKGYGKRTKNNKEAWKI